MIEIDDYIPCKPRKWYEPVASTIFSEVCNEQLYVAAWWHQADMNALHDERVKASAGKVQFVRSR